jgi:hypothetical protein
MWVSRYDYAMTRTRKIVLTVAAVAVLLAGTAQSAQAQRTLVPAGASWKFLADGTDQGTAWRAPAFDDTTWSEGRAKLGFGDENVTTVIGFGASPEAKFTTTYFRHTFSVVDAATHTNFLIRLQRDDGAIVYLNGIEIYRSNMPTGDVSFATVAASALGDADEVVFVSNFFTENHLKEGRNVLAVEVHQSDPASSDLGFDLELLSGFQLAPPEVVISAPSVEEAVVEGPIVVVVDATFVGGEISSVTLLQGETVIGEVTEAPYEFLWTALPGDYTLTARATTTKALTTTSAPRRISVLPALIRQGSVWRYLADGTNQGKAWREPGFDDSAWSEGAAELGYGDGDEATTIPSGPDSTTNYITTYFRKSFTVEDPAAIPAIAGFLTYDDGAVVYLNGVEVFRINMPTGDPAFNAPAIEGADYDPEPVSIDPKHLKSGVNVIAVEIHQASTTSSDVSFDLMLRAAKAGGVATRIPSR